MDPIYQRLRETLFFERDLIAVPDEEEILLGYVIPQVIVGAGHRWLWHGGRCYFGRAQPS